MAPYFFLFNSIGVSTLHSGHIKIEVKNGVSNLQYSPQTCLVIRIYHFFTCTCKCTFSYRYTYTAGFPSAQSLLNGKHVLP